MFDRHVCGNTAKELTSYITKVYRLLVFYPLFVLLNLSVKVEGDTKVFKSMR